MPRRHLTVEVLPELTARLDGGESRESVLAEVEVGWPQFVAIQERWLIGLAREALSGELGNLERIAAEYRNFRTKGLAPPPPAAPAPVRPFGGTMVASEEMLARSIEPRPTAEPTLASAVSEPVLATPMPRQVISPAGPAPVHAAAQAAPGRRAPARTAFDNSGFALMDEAQLRAPVSVMTPEVREPVASPNKPQPILSPSPVPPAPVSPPPFAATPVAARPGAPGPIFAPTPVVTPEPAAPPFAAPPPPAAFAEPALVPGHRNALGTLPPTPVRPAPREAQATPNPVAQRPQSPPLAAPSPSPYAPPAAASPSPMPGPYGAPAPAAPAPAAYAAPQPVAYAPPAPAAYAGTGPAYAPPDPAAPFAAQGGGFNGQQGYSGGADAAPPVLKPLTPSWELAGPGGGLTPNWGQPAAPVPARPGPSPFGGPAAGPSPYGHDAQPKPIAGPSFRGVAAQAGPAPVPIQPRAALSLEQMACIQAELDLDPNRAGATFAQNGIDGAEYQRQMSALQATLGSDAHKAERFEQLRQYYRAVLGPRR